MSENLVFSVIINTYNYGAYIEDAIVSALHQTFPKERYEIIVVDDGSIDDTRQRVQKYFPEVLYHFKSNGGQASAINVGLALARGEFVAFLDADDYWCTDKLSQIYKKFSSDLAIDVIYHTMSVLDKQGQIRGITSSWFGHTFAVAPVENYKENTTVFCSVTSGIAWRSSALKCLLPIPESYRICADGYLTACAPLVVRKFGLIDIPLGFYRIHGGNNFALLGSLDDTVQVKCRDMANHYRRLSLHDLLQLAKKLGSMENGIVKESISINFADEILEAQRNSSTKKALQLLWSGRWQLSITPRRYCFFRFFTIILRLFLPARLFSQLKHIYARSAFLVFVQRHIKNDLKFKRT